MSSFSDLLLVAISSEKSTLQEAKLKAAIIVRCLELLHQTVASAVTMRPHHWQCTFSVQSMLFRRSTPGLFEKNLPECHYVPLPKEAQLRIDDALGEMEAMDYREWNDEPLKSHREFYIIGSALWFRSYLLATHLPPSDLLDVEAFLRLHGIFALIEMQSIRDLVIWQEIYPKSVERGLILKDYAYG